MGPRNHFPDPSKPSGNDRRLALPRSNNRVRSCGTSSSAYFTTALAGRVWLKCASITSLAELHQVKFALGVTFKSEVKTRGQLRVQSEVVVVFYVEFFSQRRQTHLPESYAGRLAILRGVRGVQLFCERTTGKYLRSEKGG